VSADEAREIIRTIRSEVEQAADVMLSAAEKGLRDLNTARGGQAAAFDSLERTLLAVLEACAFQDITGQRLSKLDAMIGAAPIGSGGGGVLLNGPALPGQDLDQAAADALMGAPAPPLGS
jgi:hypothetical protein